MNVELISRTEGLNSYKELNNQELIAAVARHGSIKDDNGKLIKYLMSHKHWSPLQHISFGFKIETSRATSAQIFRHRSLNGQETSQRYEEIVEFEPVELREEHETNRQSSKDIIKDKRFIYDDLLGVNVELKEAVNRYLIDTIELYKQLLKKGVAKECARMILPMCSKTTIHITATLRDLLAFLNVRHAEETQKELRLIAEQIGEELEKELPELMGSIEWRGGYFM